MIAKALAALMLALGLFLLWPAMSEMRPGQERGPVVSRAAFGILLMLVAFSLYSLPQLKEAGLFD